ncbi:hypothetical protein T05_473 [Trichinella murrelli]|uniref:Uncharacterized protein n=1 Tax=Trichinella murrelli TaxID=144512 RepID=A0A0V0T0Q3_9BILA|nr:hypothetical protein T05_473 [Trichinella murrelli]
MRKKMFRWQWQCEIKVEVKESTFKQVKQLSLTRLFSAESLGFPRSREEERALFLLKQQGRVCTLLCLREGVSSSEKSVQNQTMQVKKNKDYKIIKRQKFFRHKKAIAYVNFAA